mgnify:CR=1 FL=1
MSKNKMAMLKRAEKRNKKKKDRSNDKHKNKIRTQEYNVSLKLEASLAKIDARLFLLEKDIEAYNLQKEDILKNCEDPNSDYIKSKIAVIDSNIINIGIVIEKIKESRVQFEDRYSAQNIKSNKYELFYNGYIKQITDNIMGMKPNADDKEVIDGALTTLSDESEEQNKV